MANATRRFLKLPSVDLLLKGAAGGSITLLAAFGATLPFYGSALGMGNAPTPLSGGIVASLGACLGIALAVLEA